MTHKALPSMSSFTQAALFASQVGTWETVFDGDRTICDETTARLFGVDPEQAAQGTALSVYARVIHPEDIAMFRDTMNRVRTQGGLVVIEYRVCPFPGELRWILARGHYERDPHSGEMTGRGIVVDITASKINEYRMYRSFFLIESDAETPLDRAAAYAILARQAIDQIAGIERTILGKNVDFLLLTIGKALAKTTPLRRD